MNALFAPDATRKSGFRDLKVVAKALAESSGSVACKGWVGVCLDLELERRPVTLG